MSNLDKDIQEGIAFAIGATGLGMLLVSTMVALPLIAVGFGGWIFYKWKFHSPAALEKQAQEHTHQLYNALVSQRREVPSDVDFGKAIVRALPESLHEELSDRMIEVILELYDAEGFEQDIPPPPAVCNSLEGARYRDFLSSQSAKLNSLEAARIAERVIVDAFESFHYAIPDLTEGEDNLFTLPLSYFLGERIGQGIESLILPFFTEETIQLNLFSRLREQLERNTHEVSEIPYTPQNRNHADLAYPIDYEGDYVVYRYLKQTPLLDILQTPVSLNFDPSTRFEHHWILAGSGHGKTQALQYLLAHDFEKVAKDEASVVVIDSQNRLINTITQLNLFGPGQPLDGKLVWIDPGDVEFPLCLNLFNANFDRINQYSMRDRERLLNNLIELYDFVLRSLLDAELTSRQSTLFQFMTRLMLHIPNATIHTFLSLLKPESYEDFEPYIAKLDDTAREFFEQDFKSGKYRDTMDQIRGRLFSILKSQTFDRMFSNTENKIDLFEELKTAKVVLINTDKDLLKEGGSGFFGRFFIAMLRQAAEERSNIEEPLPTFLYFDEAEDYFDEQFSVLLSQVRKHNIGCVIAHQYVDQADNKLVAALSANTSIKFAGGVSPKDARTLAPSLETTPEFIRKQPKLTFAAHIKGATASAVPLSIPLKYMEKMEKMDDRDRQGLREEMRRKYATPYRSDTASETATSSIKDEEAQYNSNSSQSESEDTQNSDNDDIDNPEIKPSDTW